MKRLILAGLGGLLMAVGLGVAGLTDPRRIVGFLDFAGSWDATALLVLAAAIVVFGVGHRLYLALARAGGLAPVRPPSGSIDGPLIGGALIFGVGWGLSGLCPAPALVALAGGTPSILAFVLGMTAGMVLHALAARRAQARAQRTLAQRRCA
jgi:uncharacterized membrane protein YedE/YeeE